TDWITIVGVVDDIAQQGVAKPRAAAVYLPLAQVKQRFWLDHLTFAARAAGAGDPSSVAAAMRAAVHAVDPEQAIESATMQGTVATNISEPRFNARMFLVFSLLALFLA